MASERASYESYRPRGGFLEEVYLPTGEPILTPDGLLRKAVVDGVLCAVGNSQTKSTLLLSMQNGISYTKGDLHRRMQEITSGGWGFNPYGAFGYCRNTFEPIGLVARGTTDETGSTFAYETTPLGQTVGRSMAGHFLALSEKYGVNLATLFGQTSSPSKREEGKIRSSLVREHIFNKLLTSHLPIRVTDLEKDIKEPFVGGNFRLPKDLSFLSSSSLITFEPIEKGKPYTLYTLSPQPPSGQYDSVSHFPSLTSFIIEEIRSNPSRSFTIEDLAKKYMDKPEAKGKEEVHRDHISTVLSGLKRQGYVTQSDFTRDSHSSIDLNTHQRQLLEDVVTILNNYRTFKGPGLEAFIHQGIQTGQAIISDPKRVTPLIAIHREHSNKIRTHTEDFSGAILSVITQLGTNGVEATTRTIKGQLKQQGIEMSNQGIKNILNRAVHSGQVRVTKIKGVSHYSTRTP